MKNNSDSIQKSFSHYFTKRNHRNCWEPKEKRKLGCTFKPYFERGKRGECIHRKDSFTRLPVPAVYWMREVQKR
jgi:hypothetical protein